MQDVNCCPYFHTRYRPSDRSLHIGFADNDSILLDDGECSDNGDYVAFLSVVSEMCRKFPEYTKLVVHFINIPDHLVFFKTLPSNIKYVHLCFTMIKSNEPRQIINALCKNQLLSIRRVATNNHGYLVREFSTILLLLRGLQQPGSLMYGLDSRLLFLLARKRILKAEAKWCGLS